MKENDLIAALTALPLFAHTTPTLLSEWTRTNALKIEDLPSGTRADHPGVRELGVLLKGHVEIQSADSGRTVILHEMTAPSIFGAAALFCEKDIPMSRIEVKGDARILYVPAEAVTALLDEDKDFRRAYLTFLSERVRFLNRKIRCFTAGSAERRLALWLVSEESDRILLPASVTALSDMLDIGRASLYRALDKLESEGLIRRNGKEIFVLSQENILKKYQ